MKTMLGRMCHCGHGTERHYRTVGVCDVPECGCPLYNPAPVPGSETVCQEADRIVGGEKRKEYGPVTENLVATAKVWSGILKIDVTPAQVCLCMCGLKLIREAHDHKRDNIVDNCGWARVLELYYEEKDKS